MVPAAAASLRVNAFLYWRAVKPLSVEEAPAVRSTTTARAKSGLSSRPRKRPGGATPGAGAKVTAMACPGLMRRGS